MKLLKANSSDFVLSPGKTELLLQSSPLSVGKLLVRVVSANRVAIINQDPLYCTVSIGK